MLAIQSSLRCLLLAGLSHSALAQTELPSLAWTRTTASTRGALLTDSSEVWLAPRGEAARRVGGDLDGGCFDAASDAKGILLGGSFGLAHLPWDELDGQATVLDSIYFHSFAVDAEGVDGGRVLVVDQQGHAWRREPDGGWTRFADPLPGDHDLGGRLILHGASGRWVLATSVAGKSATSAQPVPAGERACYWSDDLSTWHEAKLPAEFERAGPSALSLVGGTGMWAAYFGGTLLLISQDGKTWTSPAPAPMDATWIAGLVVVEGKLLVLEQQWQRRGRLHGRSYDGAWSTRELPEGARIQHMFAAQDRVQVIGQRGPSEAPKLFFLEDFLEPWAPVPLPPCATLRHAPTHGTIAGLRTVDDRVVADCVIASLDATLVPFTLEERGWEQVTRQRDPKLHAETQASAAATQPPVRACAGDACVEIDADGRLVRSFAGAAGEVVRLEPDRRFRALARGAGQWAALDADGRLLLSSDAATWLPATTDALRFAHLGGSDGELVAITAANEVLAWRCPPGAAGADGSSRAGRFVRVHDTRQLDLGPLERLDTFWGATFDGSALAALVDGALLVSRDGEAFSRREIVEGPLPMRLQLASHGGRWWTIEWRDESTPEVSKVKSTVRWHGPNGAVAGSHPFPNQVHLESASDGRIVALLGSTLGTSRIDAWINWTADGGQTWGWCLPGVEVAPVHRQDARGMHSIGGIAHGNGLWVVAGWSKGNSTPQAAVAVSRDLVKWETHLLPDMIAAPHTLRFAHGRFIALSQEAKGKGLDVLVSTDGVTWTAKQLSDMPAARLAIGMQRLYLHSGETVLASDDASEWRDVVAPRIEPRWMAEVEGMLCYAAAEPTQAGAQAARLRFVRTPAPSKAVHAQASPRFAYKADSMSAQLASFQRLVEGLSYDREAYAAIDKHIADLPPITEAYAKEFVLAMFAKRRTPNMIYRLAEVVASEPIRKATKELLTPVEQSTLREYATAAKARSGHLAESIKKLPAPPKSDQIPTRAVPLYDLNAAHQRYQQGSAGAAYDLAIAYAEGKGVEKDMNQARIYGEYAVKRLGAQPSMDQLAAAGSITGLYASAIEDLKAERYTACADRLWTLIDMNAYIAMATAASMCIFDGSMAVCTVEQAYTWLHWMAVKLGDAEALNSLGVAVSQGIGVPADEDAAIQWYELAAARGSKLAASNLDSARKRKEYFDGLKAFAENSSESTEIMNEMSDALGDYAGTLNSALEDTELAASPKYLPGTMLGAVVDGVFQPELYVSFARADGDYRVMARSTRMWKDRSTTPPSEHTLWKWEMRLAGITELDRWERAAESWVRCATCDTRGIQSDAEKGPRLCSGCSGKGFVPGP